MGRRFRHRSAVTSPPAVARLSLRGPWDRKRATGVGAGARTRRTTRRVASRLVPCGSGSFARGRLFAIPPPHTLAHIPCISCDSGSIQGLTTAQTSARSNEGGSRLRFGWAPVCTPDRAAVGVNGRPRASLDRSGGGNRLQPTALPQPTIPPTTPGQNTRHVRLLLVVVNRKSNGPPQRPRPSAPHRPRPPAPHRSRRRARGRSLPHVYTN